MKFNFNYDVKYINVNKYKFIEKDQPSRYLHPSDSIGAWLLRKKFHQDATALWCVGGIPMSMGWCKSSRRPGCPTL